MCTTVQDKKSLGGPIPTGTGRESSSNAMNTMSNHFMQRIVKWVVGVPQNMQERFMKDKCRREGLKKDFKQQALEYAKTEAEQKKKAQEELEKSAVEKEIAKQLQVERTIKKMKRSLGIRTSSQQQEDKPQKVAVKTLDQLKEALYPGTLKQQKPSTPRPDNLKQFEQMKQPVATASPAFILAAQ